MVLFKHELRQGRTALLVWTAAIAVLLVACVLLFPEMKGGMAAAGHLFASLGGFSAAFGMDRLDVGTLSGYYAVECGTVLGLGGAFYACLAGVSALVKEERGRTAEFLLTHPISRARAVTEKLAAVLVQVTAMSLALLAVALAAIKYIGETVPWMELFLLHGAYWLLQMELACLCFGISAFLRRGGAGQAMGLAAGMYFLNMLTNLSDRAAFLKAVTPFAYCEGADILAAGGLDAGRAATGIALACAAVTAAWLRYQRKDIL